MAYMAKPTLILKISIFVLLITLFGSDLYAKEEKIRPKEFGVYIKTPQALIRIMPNIVFTGEGGVYYIESNNPKQYALKDIEYFVIYGKYNLKVLTFNPLLFLQAPLGKPRFMFGQDIEINVSDNGGNVYIVKPKALLWRGYFSIWIEETAWDFVIE